MRAYAADKDAVLKRLRRVEGQVRGLQRMVEDDSYCIDVLTQISAATRALEAVALNLLEEHPHHCAPTRSPPAPPRGRQDHRSRRRHTPPGPLLTPDDTGNDTP